MSERNSPVSLDTEVIGGRRINNNVENIDPPSECYTDSTKYPSFYQRKNKLSKPKKDTDRTSKPKKDTDNSWVFDGASRKWLEPDDDLKLLSEKSDDQFDLPGKKDKEEDEDKDRNKKDKMNPYMLSEILKKFLEFAIIDDTLHCYDPEQGFWRCIPEKNSKDALRKMIPEEFRPVTTAQTLSETYHWLKTDSKLISNDELNKRKDYLNFANGVFSLEKQKLLKHDSKLYFQNILQVDYPDKGNKKGHYYEEFLKRTFGEDKNTILCFEEFLGLVISSVRDSKQSFFLYGPSNTGKSVILNVLKRILGIEFTSSLSFSQLGNEFAVAQLMGKWLNISGEMSGVANKRIDLFKSLVGNDLVMACFKGKDHFQFQNQALLVFACNNFPEISSEFVEAFISRIRIFPFLNVVPRNEWIDDLSEKLFSERDIIIERAIEGLFRLRKRNFEFLETEAMRHCKERFLGEANSFLLFAKRHIQEDVNGQCTSSMITEKYHLFCQENDLIPLADNVWSKLLQENFSVKKCNITSGTEIEQRFFKYNCRGYKGVKLICLEELEESQDSKI